MTARSTNSRSARTPAARRAAAGIAAPFAPMSFAKRDQAPAAERIVLFEIDGTEYTIPATVPTGQALELLTVSSVLPNEARRGIYLLRELAGPDALEALLGESDITDGDWHKLVTIMSEHSFGRLEEVSGN